MIKAAAVLILKDHRVLAFKRFNEEGLSLPCGKIEPGETAEQAAVRETLEETGLVVDVSKDKPFYGFDAVGGAFVTTFKATVVSGDLSTSAEGVPLWAGLSTIAHGPYWHYNQRMLRHFGIKTAPLIGKFHSHITITAPSLAEAERGAKLTGGKLTVIDLGRGDLVQTDYMITHHYVTGVHGLEDENDIVALLRSRGQLLKSVGISVDRLKLEYDLTYPRNSSKNATYAVDVGTYTEIHVKCLVQPEDRDTLLRMSRDLNWHPSRNPYAKSQDGRLVQFVNRRFYKDVPCTLADIDTAVDTLIPAIHEVCEVEEVKYETAVFDTLGRTRTTQPLVFRE